MYAMAKNKQNNKIWHISDLKCCYRGYWIGKPATANRQYNTYRGMINKILLHTNNKTK